MFIATNRIPVAAGHEAAFEERFRYRARLVEQTPGFLRYQVMRPVRRRLNSQTGQYEPIDQQGYYLVMTCWRTEEEFWAWTRSDAFRAAHSNRPPAEMFAGPNVLELHEVAFSTDAGTQAET